MNEKKLEEITGLSRRQIIMLQKKVIERKNKIVVGIAYDYSNEEVELFLLAKLFKDCGYTYPEIKKEMDNYNTNKVEVIDKAVRKIELKMIELENNLKKVKELKEKEVNENV